MASDPLADPDPGGRWVVRHRLADGSATDAIGWLDGLDANSATLTRANGSNVRIERAAIIAARRAPAAPGGPDPRRIAADIVERRALTGWLAWHEPLGEWTLRAGGGFTARANSCLAIGDPRLPVAEAAERVLAYSVEHRIAPMAQVVTGAEPDQQLRALGWVDTYVPTEVLSVRLADLLTDRRPDPRVDVSEQLDQRWSDAYQQSRPNDADPQLLAKILAGHPPTAFAAVVGDDRDRGLMAIARGHCSADWLGLASIWVRDDHRRRGWATRMITALGHWAARQGARYAYLQVASANEQAITAYERLGFVRHHRYHYLRPLSARATSGPVAACCERR